MTCSYDLVICSIDTTPWWEYPGRKKTNITKKTSIGILTCVYPPTPADARGSAPGNNTFDPCFGLLPPHYHGVSPSGSCLLNRRSSSSNSSSSNQQQLDWMVSSGSSLLNRRSSSSNSSSNQQQLDWMVFSHLATVFWTARLSKNIVFLGFQTTR